MSIRRIGGFNPSVQTPGLIQGQRRVEAVEKHLGTEDAGPMSEEDSLAALNAQHQAELEALEAERAQRERETSELRAKLLNVDGFERSQRQLVDLKGGTETAPEASAGPADTADPSGILLAQLVRASTYAAAKAESARAEAEAAVAAEAEAASLQGGAEVGTGDEDWMQAELSALQSELEGAEDVEEVQEAYRDLGADSFLASLDDIANLEPGGADLGGSGGDAFFASLDDIAHLVPELAAQVVSTASVQAPAGEPAPVVTPSEQQAQPVGLPFDEEPVAAVSSPEGEPPTGPET
jgi:hypothetical protein